LQDLCVQRLPASGHPFQKRMIHAMIPEILITAPSVVAIQKTLNMTHVSLLNERSHV
jgi:hypothetical protein